MRIIFATGGSGGHIFPALAVARDLKKNGHEIIFLGALKNAEEKIKKEGFASMHVDAFGLSVASIRKCLTSALYMMKAIVQSYQYIKRIKPDVVVGFGGYGAFAGVFSGVALHCPTVIHEQNAYPGKSNRFLGKIVDKIAVSFAESKSYFCKDKTVLTGCPTHVSTSPKSKKEILELFRLQHGLSTILIFGGSQGSRKINRTLMDSVEQLSKKIRFQVIHITGKYDLEEVKQIYKRYKIPFFATNFLTDMDSAYTIADLVISRAGAATITEIALYKRPAILIPYLFAGRHQRKNAEILEKAGCAQIIEEKNLTNEKLNNEIIALLNNTIPIGELSRRIDSLFVPDATERLAKTIVEMKK